MQEILSMEGIYKSFAGVKALKNVRFHCQKGEVHVLAGENGAGKSTLLKILAGIHREDAGEIILNGTPVKIKSPAHSQRLGIAMVFQELTLVNELTVAENIFLNQEPRTKLGFIDKKEIEKRLREIMDHYQIYLEPDAIVGKLSVAKQQMVEILKILIKDPELIILDEPTSALAKQEVERLYHIIRTLTEKGKTIIFISHRMEEVFEIGDRITVFKDGEYVGTEKLSDIDEDKLVRMMVGRAMENIFPEPLSEPEAEVVFEVQGIRAGNVLRDISFEVKKGEIIGITGLEGHGQTQLLNAIGGLYPLDSGSIKIRGESVVIRNAKQAISKGIALVPSNRKTEGLMLDQSILNNAALASLWKRKKGGIFIDKKKEKQFLAESIQRFAIKTGHVEAPASSLSGGNQQKVVLAKELAISPKVILFNEPTRGIDVEAKYEFYTAMRELARDGVAVIMCSSDLMEVIGMSSRVIVMYEGKVSGVLDQKDLEEEKIMRYAVGLSDKAGKEGKK